MKLILLLGLPLLLLSGQSNRLAWAGPAERAACEADRSESLRILRDDERKWREEQRAKQALLEAIQRGDALPEEPTLSAPCDCRPNVLGCEPDFWTTTMHMTPEQLRTLDNDPAHGCLKIYMQFGPNLQASVSPGCFGAIAGMPGAQMGCGLVRRQLKARQLTKELGVLKRHLEVDAEERRRQIAQDHHDCLRESNGRSEDSPRIETDLSSGAHAKVIPAEGGETPASAEPAATVAKPPH